ncbi:hydrogenase [Deferribacter autotrophicus]|uniref:Hydrogenase n=1 Tax=Deferribacter autotrophicus TaxID=500465 RepID=A0A5A8F367_9BACT|nr:proton-conducting transporter membrane subunit [Deferribacter autotrophicus]KAA0258243.1 hydrogenase [Deferribacter autotrophicus]
MVELVFLLPLLAGIIVLGLKKYWEFILLFTGLFHFLFTLILWFKPQKPFFNSYFALTSEGLLVLLITSFLFLFISMYSISYLKDVEIGNEQIFIGSMLLFLSAMSAVAVADHIIVMWIAIEATTLASAPLIFIHKSKKSLEATWKYILICSVGIALALLGSFLVALSMNIKGIDVPLSFTELSNIATKLDKKWLKAAFVFILVGYGTKMGLAPMHTWLPDAHSEAPSPASALLSGALLNCAYLAIFKTNKILHLAGIGSFSDRILIVFGLISIFIAATFALKQSDYKRLLAYSSIENMGIIAFGTGIGGIAAYGAILHLIHHSLIKSSLFLTSGNILLAYGTKLIDKVGGAVRLLPKTFVSFFAGFIGIAGFPPFGIFISEFFIIIGAFKKGYYVSVGIFIFSLIVIFAGFSRYLMKMSFDDFDYDIKVGEKITRIFPQYALLLASLVLTFCNINYLNKTILNAIAVFGGIHG